MQKIIANAGHTLLYLHPYSADLPPYAPDLSPYAPDLNHIKKMDTS